MSAVPVETVTLIDPVTVTLKRPGQEEREETISEVTLYEFRAKDLRALDGLDANAKGSQMLAMIARITRQPMKVIDELRGADLKRLGEKVEGFLPDGPATGQTD